MNNLFKKYFIIIILVLLIGGIVIFKNNFSSSFLRSSISNLFIEPYEINITAYLPIDIGIDELSYHSFLNNISKLYQDNGISISFNANKIIWYQPTETCSKERYGNHLSMCVGPNKGGYLGPPWFQVGANTNSPFGFTPTGVRAEAHELAHFLGVRDLYWLTTSSESDLKAPVINGIGKDIMFSPYPYDNTTFNEWEKNIIKYNIERLKEGKEIIYPANRTPLKLNIKFPTFLANRLCNIYISKRDYNLFKSKLITAEGPSLSITINNEGNFQIEPSSDEVDLSYIYCPKDYRYWLNFISTENCFIKNGLNAECNISCSVNNGWCAFTK